MATSKKRKPAAKRPQLSKMDLLPVPATKARDVSLRSHVALENLRNGYLDIEHAADLTKTLYICYFLSGDQLTEEGLATMVLAEAGLKRVIDLAVHSDTGRLEPDECQAIGAVLDEHDYLLIRTARIRWNQAHHSLLTLYDQGRAPSLSAILAERRVRSTLPSSENR